jgi:nicotinic acid phosphoribosyltransferase
MNKVFDAKSLLTVDTFPINMHPAYFHRTLSVVTEHNKVESRQLVEALWVQAILEVIEGFTELRFAREVAKVVDIIARVLVFQPSAFFVVGEEICRTVCDENFHLRIIVCIIKKGNLKT